MSKEENDMMDEVWVDITPKHGIWKPTEVGEELIGTLLSATNSPFKGRANTKYCFETDHQEAVNKKIITYGTICLNKVLNNPELIGKQIKIVYKGESSTNDPLKKPFKKYRIFVLATRR